MSKKWVGVYRLPSKIAGRGHFYQKMGGSVSFLSKNRWEWVTFLEKWVGISFFLKNGREWVVIVQKWVGVGRFSLKMRESGLFFLKNG